MRDPARIHRIINLLHAAWGASPDMRLGQLIECAVSVANSNPPSAFAKDPPIEQFQMEDDLLAAGIRGFMLGRRGA